MYTARAKTTGPALIVYLIDASHSMRQPFGTETRIAAVHQALQAMLKELIQRSMRSTVVANRYHLAVYAYSDDVIDVLATAPTPEPSLQGKSIWKLSELLQIGLPTIEARGRTNTYAAFAAVDSLLDQHLHEYVDAPAPLICHFTDGGFSEGTEDPTPMINRIRKRSVKDGPVLIENVYVAENALHKPIDNVHDWPGVTHENDLSDDYARYLYKRSSPLPASHRMFINARGDYRLSEKAALFFPCTHIDLVRLAFVASASTQ